MAQKNKISCITLVGSIHYWFCLLIISPALIFKSAEKPTDCGCDLKITDLNQLCDVMSKHRYLNTSFDIFKTYLSPKCWSHAGQQ